MTYLRTKLSILSTLIVITAFSARVQAGEGVFPVAGFSVAGRSIGSPRWDLDLAVLIGEKSGGITGAGFVFGVSDISQNEFYAGPALAFFSMGSLWLEFVAHWKNGQIFQTRGTAAFGLFLMPFLSLGFDREKEKSVSEIGVMLKVPLSLL